MWLAPTHEIKRLLVFLHGPPDARVPRLTNDETYDSPNTKDATCTAAGSVGPCFVDHDLPEPAEEI